MDDLTSDMNKFSITNMFVDEDGYLSDEDDSMEPYDDGDIIKKYEHDPEKENTDFDNYILLCKYFISNRNYSKEKKYLQIFYRKVYKKLVIFNHKVCFDSKSPIYHDLDINGKKNIDKINRSYKKVWIDLTRLNREKYDIKENTINKKILTNILRFYTNIKEFMVSRNNYEDPEQKIEDNLEIVENLMKIL